MELKTEYEFILPRGYVDGDGNVHREGVMRLANATGIIENLFAGDLRFLEELYNRINEDEAVVRVTCPECGHRFNKEFGRLGE